MALGKNNSSECRDPLKQNTIANGIDFFEDTSPDSKDKVE